MIEHEFKFLKFTGTVGALNNELVVYYNYT